MKKALVITSLLSCILCLSLLFVTPVLAADSALFFVNNPADLTFTDMNKVATYCENYYRSIGIVNSGDMDKFFNVVRTHGAPNAGGGNALVGLVIQDSSHPSNSSGIPRGVMVVHGQFDKATVINLLKKNYEEHLSKTGHSSNFSEISNKGGVVHKFGLPEKNRELTVLSFSNYCLFSSAAVGDIALLNNTIKAIVKKEIAPAKDMQTSVNYHMVLSGDDKNKLNALALKKFENYKETHLLNKRKGLKHFFTNKVSDYKMKFVTKSITEMDEVDISINRMRNSSANTKQLRLSSTFSSEKQARKVKRKIINHLNDVIRSATSPEDKLGLSNNVRVTVEGSTLNVDSQLSGEEEQLHAFAIMSSYIARGMIRN